MQTKRTHTQTEGILLIPYALCGCFGICKNTSAERRWSNKTIRTAGRELEILKLMVEELWHKFLWETMHGVWAQTGLQ